MMHKGYRSRSVYVCVCVSVCVSVTMLTGIFFIEIQVSLGFPCCFQRIHCVDFAENALFKSFSDICWLPLPSSLLDQLSVDKRDSGGFFSSRLVCRTSDSSYNSTDSSLVTVDYQQSFMASDFFVCSKTADHACQAYTHTCMACYVITCNRTISIFV